MSVERRPSFARGFPASPELDAVVDAFARGDYAQVRSEAPKLERATDDEAVRAAARMLVDRTRPDPLAVRFLVVTGLLLVLLTSWWIAHGKAPSAATPTAASVERVKP